jgi:NAD(P)-dependent dehydrogenase (short-subunit alcohol dehydrogenase family)
MKRVCLLTGASGLLGTAFIERYADCYAIAAIHHRSPVRFATQDQEFVDPLCVSSELAINNHAVYGIRANLREAEDLNRAIAEVKEHFGQVDLLVNGAAVRYWSGMLEPGGIERAAELLDVNVVAPLRLAVAVARTFWMSDPEENVRRNRNVVNISSTAGLFVYPDLGQALYATSKAALNHLTYHLASELWDFGIRVNAIAPDTFRAARRSKTCSTRSLSSTARMKPVR